MSKLYMPNDVRSYVNLTDGSRSKDLNYPAYIAISLLSCFVLFLSACLPAPLTDWLNPSTAEVTVTTLQIAVGSSGEAGDELFQSLVEDYVASRNDTTSSTTSSSRVKVEFNIIPEYRRSLLPLLAGENPPDLFVIDTFTLPNVVASGRLLPLKTDRESLVSSAMLDDLYPEVQMAFSFAEQLYCMPREYTTLALIYNRQLFNVSGLSNPSSSWNWQDLQAAAQTITETPNDFYTTFGMILDADFSRWFPFLYQAGGRITNADQTSMTIDSDPALQSMEFYLGLNLDGYAIESLDLNSSWSGEAFGTGRIGMIIEGSWIVDYLEKEHPNLDYGISPLPRGPAQSATVLFGNCFGVSSNSQNQDEALKLAHYLTSAESMAKWQLTSNLLPARISLEDEALAQNSNSAPFIEGLSYAVPWQLPPGFEALIDPINGSMRQVYDAEIDAAEVLRVGRVIGADILENR